MNPDITIQNILFVALIILTVAVTILSILFSYLILQLVQLVKDFKVFLVNLDHIFTNVKLARELFRNTASKLVKKVFRKEKH